MAGKVLVTGATGFIGNNLVRELLRDGTDVRVLVRPGSSTYMVEGLPVEIVPGDLLDKDSLRRALAGCQNLYHVAALYRLWSPNSKAFDDMNISGTRNILEAALETGTERVVYTSTASVFGHWQEGPYPNEDSKITLTEMVDGYHRSKFKAEAIANEIIGQGLDVVVVNPTAPVGPWDIKPTPTGKVILDFLQGRIPAYINTGLNLVHVKDVARGHILALERGKRGQRYILGNRNMTLNQIFKVLAQITGRKAPSIRLPYWAALGAAYLDCWISGALLRREPRVPLAGVKMARLPMYFDSTRAVQELGMPQSPVEEALREAVQWFEEHHNLEGAA